MDLLKAAPVELRPLSPRVSGRERVLKWNEDDEPDPDAIRAAVKKKLDEVFPKLEGVPLVLKPLFNLSDSAT